MWVRDGERRNAGLIRLDARNLLERLQAADLPGRSREALPRRRRYRHDARVGGARRRAGRIWRFDRQGNTLGFRLGSPTMSSPELTRISSLLKNHEQAVLA